MAAEIGAIELRAFPDGETYLRFMSDLSGRTLVIVCTLDRPDEKFLPLLFAAATARELGATKVGLVAPYLAYMRQDRRFKPGEAVTSREVARLVSDAFRLAGHRRSASSSLWLAGRDLQHSDPRRACRRPDLAMDQGSTYPIR